MYLLTYIPAHLLICLPSYPLIHSTTTTPLRVMSHFVIYMSCRVMKVQSLTPPVRLQHIMKALELDPLGYQTHFEVGSELFSLGSWDSSLGEE